MAGRRTDRVNQQNGNQIPQRVENAARTMMNNASSGPRRGYIPNAHGRQQIPQQQPYIERDHIFAYTGSTSAGAGGDLVLHGGRAGRYRFLLPVGVSLMARVYADHKACQRLFAAAGEQRHPADSAGGKPLLSEPDAPGAVGCRRLRKPAG